MANFRLTAKRDLIGENIKAGDTIVIRDLPHESHIRTEHVREALKSQLGKYMTGGYNAPYWNIVKF